VLKSVRGSLTSGSYFPAAEGTPRTVRRPFRRGGPASLKISCVRLEIGIGDLQ
jgi:hypothetical protein